MARQPGGMASVRRNVVVISRRVECTPLWLYDKANGIQSDKKAWIIGIRALAVRLRGGTSTLWYAYVVVRLRWCRLSAL
jgi:hypothetical protein